MKWIPPALRPLLPFLAAVAVPIVALAILFGTIDVPYAKELIATMRLAAREWWAVPLFFALYALFALLLLPVGLLSAAAALAWGWKLGGTLELLACTVAAIPPFLIARRGLPAFVTRRVHEAFASQEPPTFILLLVRIVPVIPYVALNYISGLARFRMRDYLAVTLIGSIPNTFLFAWFVDTLGAGAMGTATQLRIVAACVAVAIAAVILRWAAGKVASVVRTAPPPDGADRRSATTAPPPE